MEIKSSMDDSDHYIKCFKAFSSAMARFDVYGNWVNKNFSEAVVEKLWAKFHDIEELRVLGVGSGSGEMDCMMLEKFLQRFQRINNRVVEPLPGMIDLYKALVHSKSHEQQGVRFDWRQQTIQEYEKAGDPATFHFISIVNAITYVKDADSLLMNLYNRLESGGVMFIIIIPGTTGFWRFKNTFSSLVGRHAYICAADVRSYFDQRNIPYTLFHQPSTVDVSSCFDEASEDGNLILDHLTHVMNFKETAPDDLKRRMMEYLASSECTEKIREKVMLNNQWDALVITK